MDVLIISCSKKAYELGERVRKALELSEPDLCILHKTKTKMLPELSMEGRIEDLVAEKFSAVDVILFICAAGIAVRSVAPQIRHKSEDPAVLVMDETGTYCISLLSGHAGGANLFAGRVADTVGAEPVITTATDREGRFAVDVFARKNGLRISDWKKAKDVSVRILSGETVGIASDFPVEGAMPEELRLCEKDGGEAPAVWITNKKGGFPSDRGKEPLRLIVPNITLGIGCRKNTEYEFIESAVRQFLAERKMDLCAVEKIASIDLKSEEPGLLEFARKHKIRFQVYSAEELSGLEGDFSESAFVERVTGVSNVCERAAIAGGGELKVKKTRFPKVTIAMSEKDIKLSY